MVKTSAERQAKYRKAQRVGTADDLGGRRLDCWISSEAFLALVRLARRKGETKVSVLEALVLEADKAALRDCQTDEALSAYLGVTG